MRTPFSSHNVGREAARTVTPPFPLIPRRERLGDVHFYRVGKGATAAWEATRRVEARRERAKREQWARYHRALEEELRTVEQIRGGHPLLARLLFFMLFGAVLALAAQAVPWAELRELVSGLLQRS
jgi:hypothetical protein